MLLFGFGHLSTVMARVHPDVDPGIVEARLKYLQRLPFPSAGIKVGKGGRAYYSVEDLLKLVAAFELMAAGVIPMQAAGLVSEGWDLLTHRLGEAWDIRANPIASLLLIARPDGFETRRSSGGLAVGTDEALAAWRRKRGQADRRVFAVDLLATMRALDAALGPQLEEQPILEITAMAVALESWAAARRPTARTGT